MSIEQTPRQVGEEAKRLYSDYGNQQFKQESAELDMNGISRVAHRYDRILRDSERGTHEGATSKEEAERAVERSVTDYGKAAVSALRHQLAADRVVDESRKHYQANEAAYHDLGVAEAMLDGVHINTEQPKEVVQPVPVHVEHGEKG